MATRERSVKTLTSSSLPAEFLRHCVLSDFALLPEQEIENIKYFIHQVRIEPTIVAFSVVSLCLCVTTASIQETN